ncbi:MAG: SDR family NAD(P)-dependent oxidoreductase [Candidatus Helarchaeota archaeon]
MGLLDKKVAIVTASAGAGIGQATVRLMAKEGASVVVTDIQRAEKRINKVVSDLSESYGEDKVIGIICDVTNSKQVKEMVKKTLDKFGRIDVLVNNAGRNVLAKIEKMTDEQWDMVINVNLKGTFLCSQAVAPTMIKQKSGRIISIASIEGFAGSPMGEAQYAATKSGIMGFTKALARELAPHNINVNAIAPGIIPNPFLQKIYGGMLDEIPKMVPKGRGGKPEEIAGACVFLASDLSEYVLAETLIVSGGLYIH